jgi:vacuolar-type H+-ATPase subunit E/Vma4
MGIEELSSALSEDAAKVEGEILAQARARAEQIQREADATANLLDEKERRIVESKKAGADELIKRAETIADRKRRTLAQNIYINLIRERCEVLYGDFMNSKEYAGFIGGIFNAADAELGGAVEIRADEKTAAILREAAPKDANFVTGGVKKGFVAVSKDGAAEIHCTFDSMFEKIWREVAPTFVKRIAEAINRGV